MSERAAEKFALILLNTRTSPELRRELGESRVSYGPAVPPEVDGDWAQWLGSIRVEELAESNLAIEATLPSASPEVLDQESKNVERTAHNAFIGLMLAKSFVTFAAPTSLVGARWCGRSSIRSVASLPRPVHEPADISSELQQEDLQLAARLGGKIARFPKQGMWRLNRSLHLYRQARCEQDGLERFHQYVRALEGIIKPPNRGGTAANFVARMADLAGSQNKQIFKRAYDKRGAIEHLREHEILADRTRDGRIELLEDEYTMECLTRSMLVRIVENEAMWQHFGTADAVDLFWAQSEAERRQIWGTPIDLSSALAGFDRSLVSNSHLGLDA